MRAALLVLALVLLALTPAEGQQRAENARFAPVPCPAFTWTYQEPTIAALPGAKLFTGRYEGGLYAVEIPDNWNGELALWAHGNVNPENPGGTVLRVQTPALRAHWIERGFAWAASSYRCNGSVYGVGLYDTMALRDLFTKFNGGRAPGRVYLNGVSMGGRIAVLGLREFPSDFVGGLAQCPAGQETNDVRVAIAAAAEFITGIRLSPRALNDGLSRMQQVLGKAPDYTLRGRQLASVQIELTGGPRPFAMEGLVSRFLDNVRFGVTNSPDAIVRAATNVHVRYTLAEGLGLSPTVLNARVSRKPADAALRSRTGPYRETAPFDGRLTRPLLTIQGTGDLQVPVSQQQAFRREVEKVGAGNLLVQRLMRIPGHCQFSVPEQRQAFDALVSWVRTGVRPAGDEVLGDLSNAGLAFTDPRRVGDPGGLSPVPTRR